jgi:hypothetical protein
MRVTSIIRATTASQRLKFSANLPFTEGGLNSFLFARREGQAPQIDHGAFLAICEALQCVANLMQQRCDIARCCFQIDRYCFQ